MTGVTSGRIAASMRSEVVLLRDSPPFCGEAAKEWAPGSAGEADSSLCSE